MHICASGAGATSHEGQARKHVSIPSKRMPHRPSGSKPPAERIATSTRISLHHHGSLIIHCRSTWTRTTPRALSLPHTSAHTLHHRRHAACLSWLLQGCSVRPRRKHSSAIAGVRITVHNTRFKLAWPKQRQQSMRHALHPSCPLTWVLLRTLLGRRYLAPAVILHSPVHLVEVTAPFTILGAFSLDRRVLGVGVAFVAKQVVGHE